MNTLESLLDDIDSKGINIQSASLPENINGLYYDDTIHKPLIVLNELLKTQAEQACVIAEELGH